ncbi:MAG: dephospho-CoA kinase [Erysipelotrichaceae bacterium]|nr:dephospho-CoA kinase [Erysipelotrichaceae bacterium]MDY5251750.1 dephospho-CoA kinase [Erysipelotrichaceae bacterium]
MKIAICGTIASGKTEACKIINAKYPVLNCDELAKKCYQPDHEAYAKILALLGNDILTHQQVDFQKVANIIFNDPLKRRQLEAIIHPYVKQAIMQLDDKINFVEIAILFACGWEDLFDRIVVITCDKNIALKRMMEDRGYSLKQASERYMSQLDPQIQIAKADDVIYNNGTKLQLQQEIDKLLERIVVNDRS